MSRSVTKLLRIMPRTKSNRERRRNIRIAQGTDNITKEII